MPKNNILFIIWGIIVFIVITLLTILGFMLKNINKNYKTLEDKFITETEKYTSNESYYPTNGSNLKITKKELMEKGYLKDDLKLDGDTCDGYVVVRLDGVVKYDAYIKCKKYTTKDYEN